MKTVVDELDGDNWQRALQEIEETLRRNLLGPQGLVRRVRRILEIERSTKTAVCRQKFAELESLDQLDDHVNSFLTELKAINDEIQDGIYYDFPAIARNSEGLFPSDDSIASILDILIEPHEISATAQFRLGAALCRVLNSSLGQSNKSNAGNAGEYMAEGILKVAGLKEGHDYRKQYKSKRGSDTDYVIPAVENFKDHEVNAFIAVQLSTNDRARLASSELKIGAKKYLITGNGTDASSKSLKDIGYQIIADYKENMVLIVCHVDEIRRETARLQSKLKTDATDLETQHRLEYIENLTLSFEEFARRMRETTGKGH